MYALFLREVNRRNGYLLNGFTVNACDGSPHLAEFAGKGLIYGPRVINLTIRAAHRALQAPTY